MSTTDYYYILHQEKYSGKHASYWAAEEIISFASDILRRRGASLEELAGIGYHEDDDGNIVYEREITADEELAVSLEVLFEEEKMFYAHPITRDGSRRFLIDAESEGIYDEAFKVVEKFGFDFDFGDISDERGEIMSATELDKELMAAFKLGRSLATERVGHLSSYADRFCMACKIKNPYSVGRGIMPALYTKQCALWHGAQAGIDSVVDEVSDKKMGFMVFFHTARAMLRHCAGK